jgi:hypothetical protein
MRNVEISEHAAGVRQNQYLILDNSTIKPAHLAQRCSAAADGLYALRDIIIELGWRHVIEIVMAIVVDEVAHHRTRLANEFIRNPPHLAEGAVYDFGAQIGTHEQYAVVDRVEHSAEFLEKNVPLTSENGGKRKVNLARCSNRRFPQQWRC